MRDIYLKICKMFRMEQNSSYGLNFCAFHVMRKNTINWNFLLAKATVSFSLYSSLSNTGTARGGIKYKGDILVTSFSFNFLLLRHSACMITTNFIASKSKTARNWM